MKYFVQYYVEGPVPGTRVEAVGGDSVLPLDGRVSLYTAGSRAEENARYLRGVGRRFIGYTIHRSSDNSFTNSRQVSGYSPTAYGRKLREERELSAGYAARRANPRDDEAEARFAAERELIKKYRSAGRHYFPYFRGSKKDQFEIEQDRIDRENRAAIKAITDSAIARKRLTVPKFVKRKKNPVSHHSMTLQEAKSLVGKRLYVHVYPRLKQVSVAGGRLRPASPAALKFLIAFNKASK